MEQRIRMEDAFSESDVKMYSRGDVISGTVVQVNESEILVDIGYKSEGILPVGELSPFREDTGIEEGEEIKVLVTYIDEEKGTVYASEKQAEYEKRIDVLEEAYRAGEAVEGEIVNEVKSAGYHVNLDGIRAFLPGSHLGGDLPGSIDELRGQRIKLKILELSRRDKNLVVSHKAYLKEQQREKRMALFDSLERDQELDGIIRSIVDFGLFVDIGGFEGLVHRSEIAWKDLPVPPPEYKIGDAIKVKVIDFDKEKGKVSLSIKRMRMNPWEGISDRYPAGAQVDGQVVSVTDFGAFMKITDEVDGLIHVSEISDERIATPADVLAIGSKVQAKIIGINEDKRQVRLSMRNLFGPPEIPSGAFEGQERDRAATGRGGKRRKERGRTKERVDRRFLDEAGHESLSMRDLLGAAGIDDDDET